VVQKSGSSFHAHLREKYSYMTIRSAQRYIELAQKVDLDTYPTIGTAGIVRLKKLIDVVGDKGLIVDFLNDNKIGFSFNIDDAEAVRKFKDEVDALLEKNPKGSEEKPKKGGKIKSKPSFKRLLGRVSSLLDSLNAFIEDKEVTPNIEAKALSQMIDNMTVALEKMKKIQETTGSEPKE